MKLIYCTCNVSVLDAFVKRIDELGVDSYQIIEQVLAKSTKGDNRFNTPVWPGFNSSVVMQIADEQKAKTIMSAIREFNQKAFNDNELVIAAMLPMDDFCYD